MCSIMNGGSHPPAAAACRQVLPRLSGVSIWKPADRTESLHMLNLRPDEGSAGQTKGGQTTQRSSSRHREEETDRKKRKWRERQLLVRQVGVEGGGPEKVRWCRCMMLDMHRICTGKHINRCKLRVTDRETHHHKATETFRQSENSAGSSLVWTQIKTMLWTSGDPSPSQHRNLSWKSLKMFRNLPARSTSVPNHAVHHRTSIIFNVLKISHIFVVTALKLFFT